MGKLIKSARRSGLRQQEIFSQRWEPKKPKDRRKSRRRVRKGRQ